MSVTSISSSSQLSSYLKRNRLASLQPALKIAPSAAKPINIKDAWLATSMYSIEAVDPAFKALSSENRALLEAARIAQAEAERLKTPAAWAEAQRRSEALMTWLDGKAHSPIYAERAEFIDYWLGSAAELFMAARPLKALSEHQARYSLYAFTYKANGDPVQRALAAAAAKDLVSFSPPPAITAKSQEVAALLAPAVAHLARSTSPVARELAQKIAAGDISLAVTDGKRMGVMYWAMVTVKNIQLSNGQGGPNFFEISPACQAAVLLHEYTHTKQKSHVGGFLKGMAGNLIQRSLYLVAKVPGVNPERWENMGMRWNANEQEAYRAEMAFLKEMGQDQKSLLLADVGLLAGIQPWLDAAR